MNGFIFTQRYNTVWSELQRQLGNVMACTPSGPARGGVTPTHTCDATGSFHAAAAGLRRVLAITSPPFIYDNSLPEAQRRASILTALSGAPTGLEFVAYLGHGIPSGLESAGIHTRHAAAFAALLAMKCATNASVVFYACSSGAPGGFAQTLAEQPQLRAKNIWVWGHRVACKYDNLQQFVRYPGGVRWSGLGRFSTFWRQEREATLREADAAARNLH